MRAKEFLTEGLKVDVPTEDWLQDQIDYAKKRGRDSHGVPYMGKVTARVTRPHTVELPVALLKTLPGMRGEQQNVRSDDFRAIMSIMQSTGKLPVVNDEEYTPFIMVAYNGEAWVSEGNHRIMAASALGWDTLPVELRYYDGGERVESGPLYPGKIGI